MKHNADKSRKPFWLKILIGFSVPVFLIVGGVLALQIWFHADSPISRCKVERGLFRKLVCGISETYDYYAHRSGMSEMYKGIVPYFRSLPSDEEMIANFHENRADFERLVHIYREDLSVPTDVVGFLSPVSEIKEIMNRINVGSIRGDRVVWMAPDPYSKETDFLKRTALVQARDGSEARKFSGVIFRYGHSEVNSLRYLAPVHKSYYYTPFIPRVEKGLLRTPSGAGLMLETLNTYPPIKYWGECFYRQIDAHWFIRICQDK